MVIQGGKIPHKEGHLRATAFANLIEAFCHTALPDVFGTGVDGGLSALDQTIERLKADLEQKHAAQLPDGRAPLLRLHERLRQRYVAYAADDMVADRVLQLLEDEITHRGGDTMRVVDPVRDDPDKKFATHQRMATAIVAIMKAKGGCLPQGLMEQGFTPEDIAQHWAMATALAHVELNITDA